MELKILEKYAQQGNLEAIKEFVEEGGYTLENALIYAASNGFLELVKILVSLGADIHAEDEYALQWSSENGHLEVVKFLVTVGADIHANEDDSLTWAAENGHFEIVKYLISQGANVKRAMTNSTFITTVKLLSKYLPSNLYKGPINQTTETECGICLTEMETQQGLFQCHTCKKCIHLDCGHKWSEGYVYCRN